MIIPSFAPLTGDVPHIEILNRMESFYSQSYTINQTWWAEADLDVQYYSGCQNMINNLYGNAPYGNKKQFYFNRIRRIVQSIEGHQRLNRKSSIVSPVENGDAETADQFTKIMFWLYNREGVLETISDTFHGSLISGLNLIEVWMDYRSDPISGDLKFNNCPFNSILMDPYWKKQDLSDCNNIWRRSYITKREAISLMPDQTEVILSLIGTDSGPGRDGRFQYMAEAYNNLGMRDLVTYDEFYFRDFRTQKLMVDRQTGEKYEWRSTDKNDQLKRFLAMNPNVELIEQEIPTVNLAIVVQGRVMYCGAQPSGLDCYPFVPVYAYYEPQMPYMEYRLQSAVRGLRDPQFLYNRHMVNMLDIEESQINSGWKYKENSLVNPKDLFLSGNGRVLAVKSESQMSDVEKIAPAVIPASMFQLTQALGAEVEEIIGMGKESLGLAQDDVAGIVSMLRQRASQVSLQSLYDNLDRSQKLLGDIVIKLIQMNFTPGKVQNILEGERPSDQFYSKLFGTYHCVVEDGLNTSTQKQMEFAQLIKLKELGIPIPNEKLLEAATIQNKKELIDMVKAQEQQQQQMQQQQMQLQMQEAQSRIELAKARTVADQGLGVERISRVEENRALADERRAQAVKDQDIGLLNLVKALKEIETIDLNQLEKLITLANSMKAIENSNAAAPIQNGMEAQAIQPGINVQ